MGYVVNINLLQKEIYVGFGLPKKGDIPIFGLLYMWQIPILWNPGCCQVQTNHNKPISGSVQCRDEIGRPRSGSFELGACCHLIDVGEMGGLNYQWIGSQNKCGPFCLLLHAKRNYWKHMAPPHPQQNKTQKKNINPFWVETMVLLLRP